MKAAYFDEHGGPEVIKIGQQPDPVAGSGEIVVDIHAASVNGADWKVRAGNYRQLPNFPYILGRDFSGTVCALGEGATDFAIGDEVFGVCDVGQEGTYCEKIAMKQALCATKPAESSHIDIAALALIGLTAVMSIEDTLHLQSGEKILIQGGAGGVASFAIQLAKHLGAHVVSTTSAANVDYVKDLGADEVINYNAQDFREVVSDCDAVFDTVGGDVAKGAFDVLKKGGRAAFIASGSNGLESPSDDYISLRPDVYRDRPHLERIVELIGEGATVAPAVKLFSLDEAVEAQKLSESRHFRGKLVFKIR
ncbi:MAG: NADPH:quinone reductase [Rhodospirillaceae bacterium]|nr:NADPH:quinone reductase [Rhodospirillaceae bacterium]|tara:strand:+ start:4753 stop:5676 length:924 start_codon:yes stop_codon:yes gene_type:complete